jgi:hypothetical protein
VGHPGGPCGGSPPSPSRPPSTPRRRPAGKPTRPPLPRPHRGAGWHEGPAGCRPWLRGPRYPVYPVHWPHPSLGNGSLACSCRRGSGCDRPAKHPLVRHGIHDATTHAGQLERWWSRWPQANVGLATGVVFDALDIDSPAGLAALRKLASTVGLRFPGPLVRTGGGGWHAWFAPTGLGNRPPRGLAQVDWRGKGGCVLAPPSRHASGRAYRWLRSFDQAPLPQVPAALRILLAPPAPDPVDAPTRPVPVGHPYGRRVLADELARLQQARPHTRNRTLNACAFKVYRYVGGGVLDAEQVTEAFTDTVLAMGLGVAEVRRTLASARAAGLARPRGVPIDPHGRRTP